MTPKELARQKISQADKVICTGFEARMQGVEDMATIKEAEGAPIFDATREAEVLAMGRDFIKDKRFASLYAELLRCEMALSKDYQMFRRAEQAALSLPTPAVCLPVVSRFGSYPIIIGNGIRQHLTKFMPNAEKILIVTECDVPYAYTQLVKDQFPQAKIMIMPGGEECKSVSWYTRLLKLLAEYHFTRADVMIAVGGGVVSDIVGYVASAYMRGIAYYTIPTTLLAMADASVGGKTALNLTGVKNLVGAFYPPKQVIIDPEVLTTLHERHLHSGMAEIIKMATTNDAELFETLETVKADHIDYVDILKRALLVKIALVEADECETGKRRLLNFGHTLAHAIEGYSGLSGEYTHGEAVALGMLPFCAEGVRGRLASLLSKFQLPVAFQGEMRDVLPFALKDKKSDGDGLHEVFVDEIGQGYVKHITIEEWKGISFGKESEVNA